MSGGLPCPAECTLAKLGNTLARVTNKFELIANEARDSTAISRINVQPWNVQWYLFTRCKRDLQKRYRTKALLNIRSQTWD